MGQKRKNCLSMISPFLVPNRVLGRPPSKTAGGRGVTKTFDTIDFVNRVARRLVLEFDDASQGTTPGLIGSAREHPARKQLEFLLPAAAGVGSGCLIDLNGQSSKQQDIVIFEKGICPVFSVNDTPEATYYPCEGVIAVGEVKSTLNSETLEEAFRKIESAKELKRCAVPEASVFGGHPVVPFRIYGSPLSQIGAKDEEFDQAKKPIDQIFGFILCGNIALKSDTIIDRAVALWRSTRPEHAPNIIVSLNDGFIKPYDPVTNCLVGSAQEASSIALSNQGAVGFSSLLRALNAAVRTGRTVSANHFTRYFIPQDASVQLAATRQVHP